MTAYKDIITKSEKDLKNLLIEKRKALQDFRFGLAGSKTRNLKEGRGLRKEMAQILTALQKSKSE